MIQSPYEMAAQFLGVSEVNGIIDNPLILAMLKLDIGWPEHDETPWCAGFVNFVNHCCKVQRSKSLAARSYLAIGEPVGLESAIRGFDIVVLERGSGGHVGYYVNHGPDFVRLLGGNQGNKVSVAAFPRERVLGVRRVA
jgi:uncharacterized protein (TIGR02594 family)